MKNERQDKHPLKLHQESPVASSSPSFSMDPCLLIIFGAGGDLTKRKLIPAIYYLAKARLLPEHFAVMGVSQEDLNDHQFRKNAILGLRQQIDRSDFESDLAHNLVKHFHYLQADLLKIEKNHRFKAYLQKIDKESKTQGNFLFYLATPPSLFGEIPKSLSELGLIAEDQGWRRVVIEKPFGQDLESARKLNESLNRILAENQIYRIDHYLGKETVQNIMVFRFANEIFEPFWNRRYIDSVQISVAETLGVEHRAAYYEKEGALRDMVSNHLLQLLSMVAMEPPSCFQANAIRNEKVKVLEAIKTLTPEDVLRQAVRGQYDRGKIEDHEVPAYRSEPGVSEQSHTETYVALKLEVDNWRWTGVPFYLRVGKRLPKRHTEIAVQFKRAPLQLFRETHVEQLPPNFLVMQIQPEEKIDLNFTAKVPGQSIQLGKVGMTFDYFDYFGHKPSTAYETLLHDCMKGDGTLFRRADQVEYSWRTIMPILDVWTALPPKEFPNYSSGTWGPKSADELLKRDGRQWRVISDRLHPRMKKKKAA